MIREKGVCIEDGSWLLYKWSDLLLRDEDTRVLIVLAFRLVAAFGFSEAVHYT